MSVNLDFDVTDDYLTVKEFAERFKVSPTWVYEHIKCGEIPSIKIGDVVRIPSSYLKIERKTHVERLNDKLKPEIRNLHKFIYEFEDRIAEIERQVFLPGKEDE